MTNPNERAEWTYLDRTFLSMGNGFQFSSPPPPDIAHDRYFNSSDPWEVLGSALARLQAGDFGAAGALSGLLSRSDDGLLWVGATLLLGYAGPWSLVRRVAEQMMLRREEVAIQSFVPEMLEGSMAPWAVEMLLQLHEASFPPPTDRTAIIRGCLSRLLEKEAGTIDDGPEETLELDPDYPDEPRTEYITTYRTDRYRDEVRAKQVALVDRLGTDTLAIAEGDVFSVERTALRLLDRLRDEPDRSGRLDFERMRLEAATGLDFRELYSKKYHLQRLPAMAVIEDFLESGQAERFEPGRRYFFGRPIPD
jgi:hypothetical protein